MLDVSVLIVSYNTMEMTRKALSLLAASSHAINMEVVVIDNSSKDNSVEMLRNEFPNITLIENRKNVGFGRANNQALPLIKGRYVLLLNTDAFVEADTIAKTVQYMDANPQCGILGVKLLGRDGALQPSCRFFPTPWNIFLKRTGLNRFFTRMRMVDDMSWDHAAVKNCDWVPGCYYLVRKEVIDQVGLFDPRYFLYYEEIDHCFAAKKAGWIVTYYPYTSVVHIGGESAKSEGSISAAGRQIDALNIESELLYFRKNHGLTGVLIHLLLNSVAGIFQLSKDIVKLKHPAVINSNLKRALYLWPMFFRTEFAKVPTR
jgi:N-acetylglucosaminyl-diphospho-decaprenol L-rhamnosyltransferase